MIILKSNIILLVFTCNVYMLCMYTGHSGQRAKVDDEKVSDMESRLRDLERKNESLASKVCLFKQYLQIY